MAKKKGGPRIFEDQYHKVCRQNNHKYYAKNRELILFACKHKLKISEARRRLEEQKRKEKEK